MVRKDSRSKAWWLLSVLIVPLLFLPSYTVQAPSFVPYSTDHRFDPHYW